MEIRVILRGVLAGAIAGLLGFVFARIFAEPLIDKAIAYEAGRDAILDHLNAAVGRSAVPEGPEIFSRTIQSTIGIGSGVVAFGAAMGAIVAVAYLVLHGRFDVRPRVLVWLACAFGFAGIYLLPFVKYPANPPAIGHEQTIATRGHLYLGLVAISLVLLGAAVFTARRLMRRMDTVLAIVLATVGFLVVYGVVIGLLPSLGDLPTNVNLSDEFGFARSATETPQPITNVLPTPLVIDGQTIAPGQIVFPGFDADLLWKFRWYSLINQTLIWTTLALILGALVERYLGTRGGANRRGEDVREPVSAA